ncbi:hypothetical protein J6590_007816 [Homalodisca vitripennis]|nr:hypothetical protein J6590_007816 [Homalodisca vitripennis]
MDEPWLERPRPRVAWRSTYQTVPLNGSGAQMEHTFLRLPGQARPGPPTPRSEHRSPASRLRHRAALFRGPGFTSLQSHSNISGCGSPEPRVEVTQNNISLLGTRTNDIAHPDPKYNGRDPFWEGSIAPTDFLELSRRCQTH